MNTVLEQMNIVRNLNRLNNKLRQKHSIPLSQYILDIAYGGERVERYYLLPEFREELAKSCEVYNQGYDLACLHTYTHHSELDEQITGGNWLTIEENGLYFGIDTTQPSWLKIKQEERDNRREDMKMRKEKGLKQNYETTR